MNTQSSPKNQFLYFPPVHTVKASMIDSQEVDATRCQEFANSFGSTIVYIEHNDAMNHDGLNSIEVLGIYVPEQPEAEPKTEGDYTLNVDLDVTVNGIPLDEVVRALAAVM